MSVCALKCLSYGVGDACYIGDAVCRRCPYSRVERTVGASAPAEWKVDVEVSGQA